MCLVSQSRSQGGQTARAYCFTLNNPISDELQICPNERFIIWQVEQGEQGTRHIQGYIELSKPARIAALKKWLPQAHFESRRGSREQARDYCKKEDTRIAGPFERGDWEAGGIGARTDLLQIKRKIDNGSQEKEIADEHFESWLNITKDSENTKNCHNNTGIGKCKFTFTGDKLEQANLGDAWKKFLTPIGKQEENGGMAMNHKNMSSLTNSTAGSRMISCYDYLTDIPLMYQSKEDIEDLWLNPLESQATKTQESGTQIFPTQMLFSEE